MNEEQRSTSDDLTGLRATDYYKVTSAYSYTNCYHASGFHKRINFIQTVALGRFDALIATNDEMALGAIQAIEGAGLKLGVEVIVVGYDAIPDAVDAVRLTRCTLQ
ncbi:MAG: substrate-binding domain-containing protein [Sulfolobales archaeon]